MADLCPTTTRITKRLTEVAVGLGCFRPGVTVYRDLGRYVLVEYESHDASQDSGAFTRTDLGRTALDAMDRLAEVKEVRRAHS